MAGRGPAPQDPSRSHSRKKANAVRVVEAKPAPQPKLPDSMDWPEQTRKWWRVWGKSPLASGFTETDWSVLLDTALLHARVWGPDAEVKLLPELRLREAKFGATPDDRARLRIQFATADQAEAKKPAAKPAQKKPDADDDPRQAIYAVK